MRWVGGDGTTYTLYSAILPSTYTFIYFFTFETKNMLAIWAHVIWFECYLTVVGKF